MEKIYKKTKEDVKEFLTYLNNCDEKELIQIEEFPNGTFTDSKGEKQAYFKIYVGEDEKLISRRLKEYLIEKEVLY